MCVYRLHNVVCRLTSQLLDIVTGNTEIVKSRRELVTKLVESYIITSLLHDLSEVTVNSLVALIHYKVCWFLVGNFLYQVIYIRWQQVCACTLIGLVAVPDDITAIKIDPRSFDSDCL